MAQAEPSLLLRNPFHQLRRRLITGVLWHQLPPHRQIKDEPPQARYGVRDGGDAIKVGEKALWVHGHRLSWSGISGK